MNLVLFIIQLIYLFYVFPSQTNINVYLSIALSIIFVTIIKLSSICKFVIYCFKLNYFSLLIELKNYSLLF